jgi:NitT/TauT family transport system substrate-binding protein
MSATSRLYRPKLAVPTLSRRRLLQVGGLGTMGALLAACGSDDSGDGGGGEVASSIHLGINNPNYATQLPIYVAAAQGYFEEVGIEEFEVTTTDEYVPGLIGGSLNITQGDTDVIFGSAEESGSGMLFLGTYRGNEWQIMGVGPDIATPEDLVGGRITGGQRGSRNEYVQRQILTELGLDPDNDVEFVSVGGGSDARLEALIGGQVQGASVFPRHRAQLEEAGGQFIYEELTVNPQEGIAVMSDWLEDNRATVVAYLTANLQARQYLQDLDRRDEVIEVMRGEGFEIPDEFVELYEVEIEQLSPDGGFEVADMDALIDLQIELEALPQGMEWRDHIDLEPLWEAQEAAGLDRRPAPDSV